MTNRRSRIITNPTNSPNNDTLIVKYLPPPIVFRTNRPHFCSSTSILLRDTRRTYSEISIFVNVFVLFAFPRHKTAIVFRVTHDLSNSDEMLL